MGFNYFIKRQDLLYIKIFDSPSRHIKKIPFYSLKMLIFTGDEKESGFVSKF